MVSSSLIRLVAWLLLVLAPAQAWAWCTQPQGQVFRKYWAKFFPDLRIAVYISVGADSSFLHTGLSLPQAEAIVRRVLAVHNETVGPPYLVYAGTTDKDLGADNSMATRGAGIVIDSFSCQKPLPYPCGPDVLACANITWQDTDALASRGRVTFQPRSDACPPFGDQTWDLDAEGRDAAGVMLHEIGHVLGLGHTDVDPAQCEGSSDGVQGSGVMEVPPSGFIPAIRDWRRDDIEGLRAIWGEAIEHSVYTWSDPAFPAGPSEAAREALCAAVRTPPALTSAVAQGAPAAAQFVAFTDASDRVMHLERGQAGWVAPAIGAVIDPGELGVSFAPPAIAHSDDADGPARVFVIWSAAESKTSPQIQLRWALRDRDGGPWTYGQLVTPDGPLQRSKDVAVGFDPGTGLFVVTGVTDRSHPYFVAVDLGGEQGAPLVLGEGVLTPPFVFDVGKANCRAGRGVSRCVVPYTDSAFAQLEPGAPALRSGWYEVELKADKVLTLVEDTLVSEFQPRGMVDLASGPDGLRGTVGDRRYALDWVPGEGAAESPALEAEALAGGEWPIRIGSQIVGPDVAAYRLAARRLGRLCGNGELDCDEACDDGNALDGDGCSAACAHEDAPTTGDATTGVDGLGSASAPDDASSGGDPATASDTGPAAEDAGCACGAGQRREGASLLLLLLLAGRGRRSGGSSARAASPDPRVDAGARA